MTRDEWEARKVELLERARLRAIDREVAERERRREIAAQIEASPTGVRAGLRNRLLRLVDLLSTPDLDRLVVTLEALSDADLRRAAAYLEGLAEWPDPDVGST